MNLLLVDDEAIVRKGIQSYINRNRQDWHIVGEASNGREAIYMLEQVSVDVIIIDIRMPDMDGLTLMEEVRSRGLNCEVVVLSSYQDFDYANHALRYGAVRYLLKPVNPDELMEAISMAEFKVHQRILYEIEQNQVERQQILLKQMLLKQLLFGNRVDAARLWEELGQLGLEHVMLLVTGKREGDIQRNEDHIRNELETILSDYWTVEVSLLDHLLVMLVGEQPGGPSCEEALLCMKEEQNWLKNMGINIRVSYYRASVSELSITFNEGVCCYYSAVRLGRDIMCSYELKPEEMAVQIPYDLEHKLLYALRSGNAEDAYELVKRLADSFFETNQRSNLYNIAVLAVQTLRSLMRLLWEREGTISEAAKTDLDDLLYSSSIDSESVKAWFVEKSNHIIGIFLKVKQANKNIVVEQMKLIIQKEYHLDLLIRNIADELFMNASYLSSLFKQETGKTFTDYLIDYRLQKAKELLQSNPMLKVYEIAEAVGYSNPKHFSQLFKNELVFSLVIFVFNMLRGDDTNVANFCKSM